VLPGELSDAVLLLLLLLLLPLSPLLLLPKLVL
jgi:hypothetical protein